MEENEKVDAVIDEWNDKNYSLAPYVRLLSVDNLELDGYFSLSDLREMVMSLEQVRRQIEAITDSKAKH